ncbi:MAG: sugar phosphate nucleotidyltransferase [Planctomycetota bacterium]
MNADPNNAMRRESIDDAICGVVLAGGSGTRLRPLTRAINKHLLPVYNKPMIYYPLSTLMLAGIRDIVVVTNPEAVADFQALLGDGSTWGIRISYRVQESPRGIADGVGVAASFVGDRRFACVLGDNIFYGQGLVPALRAAAVDADAKIFSYEVLHPSRYGIVHFDPAGRPLELEEKPDQPRSTHAITGLYFLPAEATAWAENLQPSRRGELEIVDLLRQFLQRKRLQVHRFSRGMTWYDAGTHESLLESSQMIAATERRLGLPVGCPAEIAWRAGWIGRDDLLVLAGRTGGTYGKMLVQLADLAGPRSAADPENGVVE